MSNVSLSTVRNLQLLACVSAEVHLVKCVVNILDLAIHAVHRVELWMLRIASTVNDVSVHAITFEVRGVLVVEWEMFLVHTIESKMVMKS